MQSGEVQRTFQSKVKRTRPRWHVRFPDRCVGYRSDPCRVVNHLENCVCGACLIESTCIFVCVQGAGQGWRVGAVRRLETDIVRGVAYL